MSRRDFVIVAETPNLAKFVMIFFKSISFAIWFHLNLSIVQDARIGCKVLVELKMRRFLLLFVSYHDCQVFNLSFSLQNKFPSFFQCRRLNPFFLSLY